MTDDEKILHLEKTIAELSESRNAIIKESVRQFKIAAEEREQLIKEIERLNSTVAEANAYMAQAALEIERLTAERKENDND
jgi:seryl-tRNA synthetase